MLKETRARFRHGNDRKRPTNVSLSETLVDEARDLGINLSQACEDGLRAATKAERERQWLEENREAIESNRQFIAKYGMPLARFRRY